VTLNGGSIGIQQRSRSLDNENPTRRFDEIAEVGSKLSAIELALSRSGDIDRERRARAEPGAPRYSFPATRGKRGGGGEKSRDAEGVVKGAGVRPGSRHPVSGGHQPTGRPAGRTPPPGRPSSAFPSTKCKSPSAPPRMPPSKSRVSFHLQKCGRGVCHGIGPPRLSSR